MSERAAGEGTPTSSSRSKRPGRLRAGSRASGLLLAAMTTTPATHAAIGVLTKILYLHIHVYATHAAMGVLTQVCTYTYLPHHCEPSHNTADTSWYETSISDMLCLHFIASYTSLNVASVSHVQMLPGSLHACCYQAGRAFVKEKLAV